MGEAQRPVLSAWKKDLAVCACLKLKKKGKKQHLDLLELGNGFYTIFPNTTLAIFCMTLQSAKQLLEVLIPSSPTGLSTSVVSLVH